MHTLQNCQNRCLLALYALSGGSVKVVGVAVIAVFAVIFNVLPKRAAFQISHKFLTPNEGIADLKYKRSADFPGQVLLIKLWCSKF